MSISSEISRIKTAKSDIITAIQSKGVAVEKDEFDNCRVTLMSYSSEKNGEQPYDGVSPYDFTLPYEIIDDADEF